MVKSLNKVYEDFNNIIDYIKNSYEYKRYLECFNKLKKNDRANNLIKEIKDIQKEIVKKEYEKKDKSGLEIKYKEKLNLLNEIPLYVDFINSQTELNEMLGLVKEKIENYFENVERS